MSRAFVAGPWFACRSSRFPEWLVYAGQSREHIATIPDNPAVPGQGEATATLVAAAVPMLDALEQIESWWLTKGMHVIGAPPECMLQLRRTLRETKP